MASLSEAVRGSKPAAGDPGTPGYVPMWFENPAMRCPMCEGSCHIRSATKDGVYASYVRCFACSPIVPSDGPVKFATEADIAEITANVDKVYPPKRAGRGK